VNTTVFVALAPVGARAVPPIADQSEAGIYYIASSCLFGPPGDVSVQYYATEAGCKCCQKLG